MRILLYILIILAVFVLIGITWGKTVWNKITFSQPSFSNLNLQSLGAIASGQVNTVPVNMTITNTNNFSIPFSNVSISLYYNGSVFATTNDPSSHTIPANGSLQLTENIIFSLNDAAVNLLAQKIQGKSVSINYTVGLRIFGIPIPSINNSYTW